MTDATADYCSNRPDSQRRVCADQLPQKETDFYCTSEGYFPDPTNCSSYIICYLDNTGTLVPRRYNCPNKHFIFNYYGNKECSSYSNPPPSLCPVLNCTNDFNSFLKVYPRNTQYYYFCLPDSSGIGKPIVFRCENGWTFNGQRCVYSCPREGNFALSGNNTEFISCFQQSTPRSYLIRSCPQDFVYNSRLGHCQSK